VPRLVPNETGDFGPVQFGLDTFGDLTVDPEGKPVSPAQVIRNVITEGVEAERVGLDFFGVGEHHRDDFAISSPEMVLAALASKTERIRLGTAVTVLSSDDPLRVFERFSTLDALSDGRAEAVIGRGSFTESFPLYGLDLSQYETLFSEKLAIFREALKEKPIHWEGTHRAPINGSQLMPGTEHGLPAWIGVGGSPQSVVRAVEHGIPMTLAIIGGDPARFKPFVDLYHRAQDQLGGPRLPLGMHSPGFIADSFDEAVDIARESWLKHRNRLGRERGWGPAGIDEMLQEAHHGSYYLGSPETVAPRIARAIKVLGVNRFDFKYANGTLGHEHLMKSIRLFGEEVVPRVRKLLED
jgi:probable LLM family oxidoreductase